jgi:H+/Cl- antiporter ClcA
LGNLGYCGTLGLKVSDYRSVSDRDGPFFLFIGAICLIVSVIYAVSGKVLTRFRGVIFRDEEPNRFWRAVVMCFLGGLLFIGLYLYQNSK